MECGTKKDRDTTNTNNITEGRTAVYRQDKKATVSHGESTGRNQSAYQISRYKHCPNLACGVMFIHENELTNHRGRPSFQTMGYQFNFTLPVANPVWLWQRIRKRYMLVLCMWKATGYRAQALDRITALWADLQSLWVTRGKINK